MSTVPISVLIATDSLILGAGLEALCAAQPTLEIVGRAGDHDELVREVERLHPDVALIAIRTPVVATMTIIVSARQLRARHPQLGLVVVGDRIDGFAVELLRDGSARVAYLLDDRLPGFDTILSAIHEVSAGNTVLEPELVDALVRRRGGVTIDELSLREMDVLEQIAAGLANVAIAHALHVSTKTVERHVTSIFRKLELTDARDVDRRVMAALAYLHAQARAQDLDD